MLAHLAGLFNYIHTLCMQAAGECFCENQRMRSLAYTIAVLLCNKCQNVMRCKYITLNPSPAAIQKDKTNELKTNAG